MPISVAQRDKPPITRMAGIPVGEGAVTAEGGNLYIRIAAGAETPGGSCRCIRLTPVESVGVAYLDLDAQVQAVHINIEWGSK